MPCAQRLIQAQYVLTVFMGPELLFLRLSATLQRRVWLPFVSRWVANTASASAGLYGDDDETYGEGERKRN